MKLDGIDIHDMMQKKREGHPRSSHVDEDENRRDDDPKYDNSDDDDMQQQDDGMIEKDLDNWF